MGEIASSLKKAPNRVCLRELGKIKMGEFREKNYYLMAMKLGFSVNSEIKKPVLRISH